MSGEPGTWAGLVDARTGRELWRCNGTTVSLAFELAASTSSLTTFQLRNVV